LDLPSDYAVGMSGVGSIQLHVVDLSQDKRDQLKELSAKIEKSRSDILKARILIGGELQTRNMDVELVMGDNIYRISGANSINEAIDISFSPYQKSANDVTVLLGEFQWFAIDDNVIEITGSQHVTDGIYYFTPSRIEKTVYISKPGLDETTTSFRFRLRDPGDFTQGTFVTVAIKKDKPRIMCVMGKLKGEDTLTKQNYIFPKEDGWTKEKVQAWLDEHTEKSAEPYLKIIQKVEKEYIVGGIVYEPDSIDAQGDYSTSSEIWKALKSFMIDGRQIKIQHQGQARNIPVVESYHVESEHTKGGQAIKKGSWWMSIYLGNDKDIWEAVEKGDLTGFSMAGMAKKE